MEEKDLYSTEDMDKKLAEIRENKEILDRLTSLHEKIKEERNK